MRGGRPKDELMLSDEERSQLMTMAAYNLVRMRTLGQVRLPGAQRPEAGLKTHDDRSKPMKFRLDISHRETPSAPTSDRL